MKLRRLVVVIVDVADNSGAICRREHGSSTAARAATGARPADAFSQGFRFVECMILKQQQCFALCGQDDFS